MKTITAIISDNLVLEYHKTKKDFLVYLTRKSYPLKSSLGTKAPKIGQKFAVADIENKSVEFWERTKQDKSGNCWTKLGTFNYTSVEKTATRVVVKKQAYLHKDILASKSECELFFSDETRQKVTGLQVVEHLFNDKPLPKVKTIKEKIVNLLEIADEKLNPDQLAEKMRLEMSMGICPF